MYLLGTMIYAKSIPGRTYYYHGWSCSTQTPHSSYEPLSSSSGCDPTCAPSASTRPKRHDRSKLEVDKWICIIAGAAGGFRSSSMSSTHTCITLSSSFSSYYSVHCTCNVSYQVTAFVRSFVTVSWSWFPNYIRIRDEWRFVIIMQFVYVSKGSVVLDYIMFR